MEFKHIPVLLNECLEGLALHPTGIYVDATLGGAGHSSHIARQLVAPGHLYGFDRDRTAIEASRSVLSVLHAPVWTLIHSPNWLMTSRLSQCGVTAVDGILFDLGVSSHQLDEPTRGFSYQHNAPLDMRMDQSEGKTAADIVNRYTEFELFRLIRDYGEERYAKSIAATIVAKRLQHPILTTFELVDIIRSSMPGKALREQGHPAKRTFQAIRIELNQELTRLEESLLAAAHLLKPSGRLCVITFHSLEDRVTKTVFKRLSSPPEWHKGMPITMPGDQVEPDYRLITPKPITASEEELANNNRAHSAKLRIIERIK